MTKTPITAAAVAAVLALAACGTPTQNAEPAAPHTQQPQSPIATQTPNPNGPSQSTADAARDGVIRELAALPFSARVNVIKAVPAPEGVWAISRPPKAALKYATGCRLGPETGKYPTSTICTTEYGELLLLDSTRTRILRAYPMAAVPAAFLVVTADAVWAGRQGDTTLSETTLPDAIIYRVDRHTFAARAHVFAPGEESEVMQPCYFPPKSWLVTKGHLQMTALEADASAAYARDAHGTWTRIDGGTLKVTATGLHR